MTPPRIAVTGNYSTTGSRPLAGVDAGYVLSLRRAGAIPVIIPPVAEEQTVAALEGMDGLLLPGGRDVDPAFYNEAAGPHTDTPDRERDLFEMSMFREAQARGVPVLAICRGFQLVNVALGGTLWQDLPAGRPEGIPHRPGDRQARVHDIVLHPGSRLCGLLGVTALRSNSSHHQGVRTLAPGLLAAAETEDGLVEGWEAEDTEQWLFGVQWHPELYHDDPPSPDYTLFERFTEVARARESMRVS